MQTTMRGSDAVRFGCLLCLWLFLCYMLLTRVQQITFMTIFTIVASGIVIFVPLYKKYISKREDK